MFSAREVATVLGVTTGRLRGYLRAGFVSPSRGEDGQLRFSFQDLVLLRKAEGLVTQRIAPQRVSHALRKLRDRMPNATLSGMNLSAEGGAVVVSEGALRWQPDSGQVIFDFDGATATSGSPLPVTDLREVKAEAAAAAAGNGSALTVRDHYERGCTLEEHKPAEAMESYRAALALEPRHADSHVNLGRLLHESGNPNAALVHYRAALASRPTDATAAFNLGVALEDLGQLAQAIGAYESAIAAEPKSADAHYNLARLFEQSGKPESAIRHLLIYRQLTRKPGR